MLPDVPPALPLGDPCGPGVLVGGVVQAPPFGRVASSLAALKYAQAVMVQATGADDYSAASGAAFIVELGCGQARLQCGVEKFARSLVDDIVAMSRRQVLPAKAPRGCHASIGTVEAWRAGLQGKRRVVLWDLEDRLGEKRRPAH